MSTAASGEIWHALQMREWFSKVETARSVAQRPAPSYMRFREGADEDQVQSCQMLWLIEFSSAQETLSLLLK